MPFFNWKTVKNVGIAAYQGWTKADGTSFGADTIPAYFDYVKFDPGEKN